MKVQIIQGPTPALHSTGIIVVIDVLRAFTSAHVAFTQGARQIRMVDSITAGLALKEQQPDYILAGEVQGLPVPGFDLPNSPFQLSQCNFQSKTLILKTTYGTKAALHALSGTQVFVAGFINAKQTAFYIKKLGSTSHSLFITLIASHPTSDEDLACAEYIRDHLTGHHSQTADEITQRIQRSEGAKKFHDRSQVAFDPRDLDICAKESDSPIVLGVEKGPHPIIMRALG